MGFQARLSPFLLLLASVSSHHGRSAVHSLSVCLSGNVRDPKRGWISDQLQGSGRTLRPAFH